MKDGSPVRLNSISSSSVAVWPGRRITYATGFSRPLASWAATTTACATASWVSKRRSTSAGEIHIPLALNMSPVRPRQL